MKNILKSKLKSLHFSIILTIAVLSCSFLWFIGIPLFYFLALGSGEVGSKIGEKPIHTFISEWLPLLLVFIFCLLGILNNFKKNRPSNSKSYLLTLIVVLALYLFRMPIADLIIQPF